MNSILRPALTASVCLFVCALVMLCLTQLGSVRLASAGLSASTPATPTLRVAGTAEVADRATTAQTVDPTGHAEHATWADIIDALVSPHADGSADTPSTANPAADLSSELAELLAPMAALHWPAMHGTRPAAPLAVVLPHPALEGPQRPPRFI